MNYFLAVNISLLVSFYLRTGLISKNSMFLPSFLRTISNAKQAIIIGSNSTTTSVLYSDVNAAR